MCFMGAEEESAHRYYYDSKTLFSHLICLNELGLNEKTSLSQPCFPLVLNDLLASAMSRMARAESGEFTDHRDRLLTMAEWAGGKRFPVPQFAWKTLSQNEEQRAAKFSARLLSKTSQ